MRVTIEQLPLEGDNWDDAAAYVVEAERLGADAIWIGEAWHRDAATPLAYLAAKTSRIKLGTGIMQVGARSPVMVAMTAMSLASISHDRFLLGLGTSGPLVIEGLHGVTFKGAVTRMRETVEIVRLATGGQRVAYDGAVYKIPFPGGEGRAMRMGVPARHIPIYMATLGPKNLQATGELADGWLSAWFFPEHADVYFDQIRAGAARAGRSFDDIDKQVRVMAGFSDDVPALAALARQVFAREMGMMGSRRRHFFNDAYRRQGYGDIAADVQSLWLDGKPEEAAARVPEDFALRAHLLGTEAMVKERLRALRDAGVTAVRVQPQGNTNGERLATLGRLMDVVEAVNQEPVSSAV